MSRSAERGTRGAVLVAAGAAIAGALGFVVTIVVAGSIGAAAAAGFSAIWSGIYLVVGALSGVQQEVARATRVAGSEGETSLRRFALISAVVVLVVAGGIAAIWTAGVFGADGWMYALPLAVGPAGYVVVAIVAGALYGVSAWRDIVLLSVGDAVLRLVAVATVLSLTHDLVALAWAVALPFGLALALSWPIVRASVVGRIELDVPLSRLARNSLATIVGALATAALMSGLPLFVVITSPGVDDAVLGAITFALTVVRAPIMVAAMALQTLFLVRFRDARRPVRSAVVVGGVIAVSGVVVSALAAWIGGDALALVVGEDFRIGSVLLAVMVASSALMALFTVTGALALSRSRHRLYVVGWLASLVGLLALLVPAPFEVRVILVLLVAPVIGIAVHVGGLASSRPAASGVGEGSG